jgi:hypothetical protein
VIRLFFASRLLVSSLAFFLWAAGARPAAAQSSDPSPAPDPAAAPDSASAPDPASAPAPAATSPAVAQSAGDDDAALDPAEPDFTLVNIPTTMRLPLHKGDFHLTHRFFGNLRSGSFGQQASDLFGIDEGATIDFEYRYAVIRHLEVAASRTNFNRMIQLDAKYDAIHQGDAWPVSVSGLVSVEGANNFKEQFAPAIGAVVSREIQQRVALYASPIWVHNSAAASGINRDTFYVGLGGRVRIMSTTYVVAEVSPRLAGYAPGVAEYAFGIEKRVGGHVFQLNFGNDQGTTFGQIGDGGVPQSLFLGFNLSRKFF